MPGESNSSESHDDNALGCRSVNRRRRLELLEVQDQLAQDVGLHAPLLHGLIVLELQQSPDVLPLHVAVGAVGRRDVRAVPVVQDLAPVCVLDVLLGPGFRQT